MFDYCRHLINEREAANRDSFIHFQSDNVRPDKRFSLICAYTVSALIEGQAKGAFRSVVILQIKQAAPIPDRETVFNDRMVLVVFGSSAFIAYVNFGRECICKS
jgi:hypothetical protein